MMPTNVAARMTLAADPGLAPGRRRGRDPRRRPGDPRHRGGVRASCSTSRAGTGRRRRGSRRGRGRAGGRGPRRRRAAARLRPPVHKPVDPRAERILELADERGVSGPHVLLARALPRRRRRGLGAAADDERLDADRGGDARPRLRAGGGEVGADPRPHRRPARPPRRGARAPARLPDGRARPRRRSTYEPPATTPAADARARGRDAALGGAARARRRTPTARSSPTCSSARPSTGESSARRGSATPRRPAGWPRSRALPLTDKQELRETVTAENPIGAHLCVGPRRDRPHLLDQRHHRHAELHPADRRRPRQLGHRLGAQLRRLGRRGRASASCRSYNAGPFVAGAALAAFDRIGLRQIPVGTGNTERLMQAVELLRPEAAVAHALLRRAPGRVGRRARHRPARRRASSGCWSPASPAAASPPSAPSSSAAGARG